MISGIRARDKGQGGDVAICLCMASGVSAGLAEVSSQ